MLLFSNGQAYKLVDEGNSFPEISCADREWCRAAADGILCTHAADANILINSCRLAAQQYTYTYQEPIPVEQLVRSLCDQKQASDRQLCKMPITLSLRRTWCRWCQQHGSWNNHVDNP